MLESARAICAMTIQNEEYKIKKDVHRWVVSSEQQGLGAVHRYSKQQPVEYKPELADDDELVLLPREVAKKKAQCWVKRWTNKGGYTKELNEAIDMLQVLAEHARKHAPQEPLSVKMLDMALAKTKRSTGLGCDGWDPEAIAAAPPEAKEQLVKMMQQWEDNGTVPLQLLYNIVKLIPKPGGGERPITLMPLLVRLLFKMRGYVTTEWCEKRARHWDGAVRGSSALRTAVHNLLLDGN
jgi:hypothetical protein